MGGTCPGEGQAGDAPRHPAGVAFGVTVDVFERVFQRPDTPAEMAGVDVLVRVEPVEAVLREGALAVPRLRVETARRVCQGKRRDARRGLFRFGGFAPGRAGEAEIHFAEGQHAGGYQPLDACRLFLRAGLRRLNLDAARGGDDQPAGGGFGRTQQAQDHPPDPARHFVRTALVQPGIGEQHRDDAQKRRAVAGDGSGPVECVSLCGSHPARVGEVGWRWISSAAYSGKQGSVRFPFLRHPRA
jgi:hypothetical protein